MLFLHEKMRFSGSFYPKSESHPSRMRGLKDFLIQQLNKIKIVASLADAWIERVNDRVRANVEVSRIPRGCVD